MAFCSTSKHKRRSEMQRIKTGLIAFGGLALFLGVGVLLAEAITGGK